MQNELRIGRIAGIDINVHISWLIAFFLIAWSLATGYFPDTFHFGATESWLLGGASAVLLFAAVLAHELSHSLVGRRLGLRVDSITLFIFGGVSNLVGEPRRPRAELFMAAAGPLMSFIIAGTSAVLAAVFGPLNAEAGAIFSYLATVNLLLGAFNLIPGFPLDGGRVLHSILWRVTNSRLRATRIAGAVGQGIAYLMILAGVWQFFAGSFIDGIWLVFIGWFLSNAANSTVRHVSLEERLAGVAVRDVMRRDPITVDAETSVGDVIEHCLLVHNLRAVPVLSGGEFTGVAALPDLSRIPRAEWWATPVRQTLAEGRPLFVGPDQPLLTAFELMAGKGLERIPVVQDERLVGVLSRSDVARYLQVVLFLQRGEDQAQRRAA